MNETDIDEQRLLTCQEHGFVIVVWPTRAEFSCRGTPGHRAAGCTRCDEIVDEAVRMVDA